MPAQKEKNPYPFSGEDGVSEFLGLFWKPQAGKGAEKSAPGLGAEAIDAERSEPALEPALGGLPRARPASSPALHEGGSAARPPRWAWRSRGVSGGEWGLSKGVQNPSSVCLDVLFPERSWLTSSWMHLLWVSFAYPHGDVTPWASYFRIKYISKR